jgi:cell division protein FtsN
MARDYKNSRRKPAKKSLPGWVWMLTGLMIGLLIAFLVYLSQQPRSQTTTAAVNKPSTKEKNLKETVKSKPSENKPAKQEGLRYEFYTVLPESEIVIPQQELNEREKALPSSKLKDVSYILQAGSFRKLSEAESLKARLALLGIESSAEKVLVQGDTWYRIRIGPFDSIRDINSTRNRLRNDDINSILIRVK